MILDERLKKLIKGEIFPLAVEVDQAEMGRMVKAAGMGMPFLAPIRRGTFIRFICGRCGLDFSARADTAVLGRHRCPSIQCENRKY